MRTLVIKFQKVESDNATKCNTFYYSSKPETIINETDDDDVVKSIYTKSISNIQKPPGKGSGWIIDSVIDHNINFSKYNHLACSS